MVKPIKIGKWGCQDSGQERDVSDTPKRLLRVVITADSDAIRSISFWYKTSDGKTRKEGPWGEDYKGTTYEIDLEGGFGDALIEISGTIGYCYQWIVVKSLKFVSAKGQTYGPYGCKDGTPFSARVFNGGTIEGFFGRSGGCLDTIGIYVNAN